MLAQNKYKKFISTSYAAVVARIKILANLDIAERRLPQDGKISYVAKDGTEVDFRISVLPTNLGERIVIRILNSSSLAVTLSAIGFTEKQEEEFLQAISMPQGMILVTGPTGSGKSTILKSIAGLLRIKEGNIKFDQDRVLSNDLKKRNPSDLRAIQLIFQNPDESLNPNHTVEEILAQPLKLYFGLSGEELKKNIPETVFIYSQNSGKNFLNLINKYELVDYWMNTNLMCIGEKTSSSLNMIKWKKIFFFNLQPNVLFNS